MIQHQRARIMHLITVYNKDNNKNKIKKIFLHQYSAKFLWSSGTLHKYAINKNALHEVIISTCISRLILWSEQQHVQFVHFLFHSVFLK